jgi:ribosomal protein S18 acetylase RimI-like enzyme
MMAAGAWSLAARFPRPEYDPQQAGHGKATPVIEYRAFRNTDPPVLAQLWNACFTERGAIALRGTTLLEYFLFSKPYFDPNGLILAFAENAPIGVAICGFGPNADGSALDRNIGILCLLGVHPHYRLQGIGRELLQRSEAYLRQGGAKELLAGPLGIYSPYGFGIYGGSQCPGILDSETWAQDFYRRHGYEIHRTCVVMQRPLDTPIAIADPRFAAHRNHFEIHAGPFRHASWWQECVLGPIELHDYSLREKSSQRALARANLWEMETYSTRWNEHAVGMIDLEVVPEARRQGLGRFLLAQLLRHLQDQFFGLVECQVLDDNIAALQLLQGLGFQKVDTGRQFRKV